ncbi:MAG TPA: dienelactone hydrolase family protein [Sporichthyaceae bacterium]|jgi:dienelactone hydrolase|nr:dienelactone hydrolase family protein [Sporichthyaceae bacterium]
MAEIALFHSVLGVRPGVLDAARRLTEAGHEVLVADLYEGEVFDGYEPAMHFAQEVVGFPELLARAQRATRDLADGLFVVGFSMGAAPAEYVACARPAGGAVLLGGALPLIALHVPAWPGKTPVQLHCMLDDPWREPDELEEFSASVSEAGARLELFDYEGDGHLFTDASLTEEYDEAATELFWQRVQAFCAER